MANNPMRINFTALVKVKMFIFNNGNFNTDRINGFKIDRDLYLRVLEAKAEKLKFEENNKN